jgi:hypothetical protein
LKKFRLKLAAAASQKVPESRGQWQSDTTVLVRGDMIIATDLGSIEGMQATAATPVDCKICRPLSPILRKC